MRALICAAVVAGALIAAATASAHSPTAWFGTYSVSVAGGSQDTSWTLNHVPVSHCDASSSGKKSARYVAGTAHLRP